MNKSAKPWVKPELVRLGRIADVAGGKTFGTDGGSAQPKS